jgi:lysozyme family protein
MSNFEAAFKRTIGYEAGYVNDPDDPGGETKYGISKRSYPNLDIRNLDIPTAKRIYHDEWWQRLLLNQVEDLDIAAEIFDTAINCGRDAAVDIVQRACNALGSHLIVDGYIGPLTLTTINLRASETKELLLVTLNCLQAARYVRITEAKPRQRKYFKGWLNHRVQLRPDTLLTTNLQPNGLGGGRA